MTLTMKLGRDNETYHDPQSKNYPAKTAPTVKTVVHTILGDVLDQGDVGSCTGNAEAQLLNHDKYQAVINRILKEPDALWLYTWATHHDDIPGYYPKQDTGSGGLYVAKAAKSVGLIKGYTHAFGVDHLAAAIQLAPAIVGTVWTEDMFTPNQYGFLSPTGAIAGGHEYLIYGYDAKDDCFLMRNSWSAAWGLNGTAKIRTSAMAKLLSQHGDVVFCTV